MASQVLSGSAQGAATGYKVSGSWIGAVVGAVVGGVGGIFGDDAAKYRRKANKEEQRSAELQQVAQRRAIWRSMYLARQEAVAAAGAQETGGLQSSGPQGVLSSISTKGTSNLMLFDALIARQRMQQYYLKKAGKKQEAADMIGGLINAAGSSGMSMGGGSPGGGGGSSGGGGGGFGTSASNSGFFSMDMGNVSK